MNYMGVNKMSNLEALKKEYLGRGIIMGKTKENTPFVTYILTGRSDSSKARTLKFDEKNSVTYTAPIDMEILNKGSPVLLLYPAIMMTDDGRIAVSNGAQTELLYNHLVKFKSFNYPKNVLENIFSEDFFRYDSKSGFINITSFEPDEPNYTPRITGCVIGRHGGWTIVRRSKEGEKEKIYGDLDFEAMENGKAKLIMTYDGADTGKEPLHSFTGEPLDLSLEGRTQENIAHEIKEAINQNTFIAVATQFAIGRSKPYIINLHGDS